MSLILNRIENHFGYSDNDDSLIASSDYMYVEPGKGPFETYKYEKEDKEDFFKNLVARRFNLIQRLKTEFDPEKVGRIKTTLANIEQTFSRNQSLILKVIKKFYGNSL